MSEPPGVAILGAGPVGLDAALACSAAGLPFTVYEAGTTVAHHVRDWGHVRLFTPWELNISPRMRAALAGTENALPPPAATPTGHELVTRLLDPVAQLPALAGRLRLGTRVLAVSRTGYLKHEEIGTGARATAPFRLLLDGPDGEHTARARLVLDCTGSYAHPNTLGDGGIPAPGERALGPRIVRTLPALDEAEGADSGAADRWAGTVLLVGAGKSAQTAARGLAALPRTRLEWVVRDPHPTWGAVPDDPLPGRRRLVDAARSLASGAHDRVSVRTGSRVEALQPEGDGLRATLHTPAGPRVVRADHVLALTGYAGDAGLYRQLQIHECYATGAPMNLSATLLGAAAGDCLAQPPAGLDTLRSPEPDFFVLGAKSYGRLGTFLLRAGYEQVGEVVAAYAPDGGGR
ncbi:NAD(P)-binding domain-containing protein [Streptomyces sp. N2-109]|uniref:NAD(P)-binding domain-containing protein n=1 Tax=Streptomyces gossypii TaxID=2883101 RepID=A0ABT2JML2_9ACTN|nr:NAD(P)-binding domain-containing protein [Streptomyces gossypii]MCT2589127.1 NAD(P)-binding domain-containing protein [Streptomyces gossypii]